MAGIQPLGVPAGAPFQVSQPVFAGYRDRTRQEPGEEIADRHYDFKNSPVYGPLIREAEANYFSPEIFDWDADVALSLRRQLDAMTPEQVVERARFARTALENTLPSGELATLIATATVSPMALSELKTAIVKRQMRALNSIANHAQTAEQPSVAPLTFAIRRFEKTPHLQRLFSLFNEDESNHAGILRRYITEKLGRKEQVSPDVLKKFKKFEKVAMGSTPLALLLGLCVETMGNSYFEFFGEHAPDPLLKEICRTVAAKDERFHVELFRLTYQTEFNRGGGRLEKLRNQAAITYMLNESQKIYPYMVNACLVFGVEPQKLLDKVNQRLREAFEGIPGADEAFAEILEGKETPLGKVIKRLPI